MILSLVEQLIEDYTHEGQIVHHMCASLYT